MKYILTLISTRLRGALLRLLSKGLLRLVALLLARQQRARPGRDAGHNTVGDGVVIDGEFRRLHRDGR